MNSSFSSPINSNGTPLSPYKVFLPQVLSQIFGGHALFSPGPKNQLFYSKDFSGVVGTQNDRLDLLSPNKFSLGKFDKAFPRYGPVYEFCARNLEKKSKPHIFSSIYLYLYVKEAQFNADQHKIGPVRIGQIPTRLSQKN